MSRAPGAKKTSFAFPLNAHGFIFYVLALFLIGVGYIAITPPFEGFDEYAHFSSIREIASTGTLPVLGSSFIDRAYEEYKGPKPYGHLDPPYDRDLTYAKFFAQPDLMALYEKEYRQDSFTKPFSASTQLNWQAQHPPLYYLVLTPFLRFLSNYSLVDQIFGLRLVSFILALGGVAMGYAALFQNKANLYMRERAIGFLLYPILFPEFFPEFARLGNDALCLFLVGASALSLAKWQDNERPIRWALFLGIFLGLGLLTKALFIPIVLSIVAFLTARFWTQELTVGEKDRLRSGIMLMLLPLLLIGSSWYVRRLAGTGDLIGDADTLNLRAHGGMLAGLHQNFTIKGFLFSLFSLAGTYFWAGTWSLARFSLFFYLLPIALFIFLYATFAFRLKHVPQDNILWLVPWLALFFGVALADHLAVGLALDGTGQTPGWYLHILAPWTAPALGMGAAFLLRRKTNRRAGGFCLLYLLCFHIGVIWGQIALFSGCATKAVSKNFHFQGEIFCLDRVPDIFANMAVLGYSPSLALGGIASGLVCVIYLVRMSCNSVEVEAL